MSRGSSRGYQAKIRISYSEMMHLVEHGEAFEHEDTSFRRFRCRRRRGRQLFPDYAFRCLPDTVGPARVEDEVSDTDARLWHPWLRINRVLRVMLRTRWSADAWAVVRVEFKRALALRSELRRAGWFN